MEWMIFLVVPAAYCIGHWVWHKHAAKSRHDHLFTAAARELGLTPEGRSITGSCDGFSVSVAWAAKSLEASVAWALGMAAAKEQVALQMQVEIADTTARIRTDLEISRDSRLKSVLTGEDIATGDGDFDDEVRIKGPELVAVALMNHATRRHSQRLVAGGGSLAAGKLRLQRSLDGDLWSKDTVVQVVQDTLAAAAHLRLGPGGVLRALAANAAGDPLAAVRLRNLSLLLDSSAGDVALTAARTALGDPDPRIRLVAARSLCAREPTREEGFAALVALTAGALAAEAFECLLSHFRSERVGAVVVRALDAPDGELRRAALDVIGRHHYIAPPDRVLALADAGAEPLDAVARTLGQLGDARAEPALLRLLGHSEEAVRTAAITALGAVGTSAAIAPLLAQAHGATRAAVLAALSSIRGRCDDIEPGRLSLVEQEDQSGGLSLPEADGAGGLTRADDDKQA